MSLFLGPKTKINNGIMYKKNKNVNKIKGFSRESLPVAVGFGIKDAQSARKMAAFSDGIIIGSSIVELIHKYSHNKTIMNSKLSSFLKSVSKAI